METIKISILLNTILKKIFFKDIVNEKDKIEKIKKGKNKMGFIAQEVLSVLPDVVKYDSVFDDYMLSYREFIALLVNAMQEQQLQIEELTKKIKDNEEKLKSVEVNDLNSLNISGASLNQNRPNPFNENTKIDVFIPTSIENDMLNIYNLQGKQIKSIQIDDRQDVNILIEGSTLIPGIYYYSLITDGVEIDSKKMILTD